MDTFLNMKIDLFPTQTYTQNLSEMQANSFSSVEYWSNISDEHDMILFQFAEYYVLSV